MKAQKQKQIEEVGLLIERLDDCFRNEANDSFHNYVGLVKEMTSIVAEHLSTIATESAYGKNWYFEGDELVITKGKWVIDRYKRNNNEK